ncbi:MAG: glycosyltransferase family 4 protein, partial [Rhodospirillales bacterium]|nr:glycosyltransferase family 4 protein [Acetobacter sp.]
ASYGIGDQVHFPGASAHVAQFYAAADLFVLPTQYEAWGLVVVEALACGLPVLTSRLAGAAVAVEEGLTGELLDEPRDEAEIAAKLATLLDRRHRFNDEEISRSVNRYEWSEVLTRYEEVLYNCARPTKQVVS